MQELARVLFDAIEESCKGTQQENLINNLYQGTITDYVQCRECQYESCREAKFLDLSLTVRNEVDRIYSKSVEQALENYIKPEILSGNNQY